MKEKIKIEDTIDITDEIALYSTKELSKLFEFLDKNDFKKMYFDGYNATIEVIRVRNIDS